MYFKTGGEYLFYPSQVPAIAAQGLFCAFRIYLTRSLRLRGKKRIDEFIAFAFVTRVRCPVFRTAYIPPVFRILLPGVIFESESEV